MQGAFENPRIVQGCDASLSRAQTFFTSRSPIVGRKATAAVCQAQRATSAQVVDREQRQASRPRFVCAATVEAEPSTGAERARSRTYPISSLNLSMLSADAKHDMQWPVETDKNGLQRLKLLRKGWQYWMWRGNRIHYIEAGDRKKPPVVLVHGFGASAYHWRYVIPELAKDYSVFAIDLLGFGFSEKPSVVYNGYSVWGDQLSDFIQQVIGGRPAVLVGNSMGAYASMLASAYHPEVSRGLVLVNGAGRFEELKASIEAGSEAAIDVAPAAAAVQEAAGVASEMPDRPTTTKPQPTPELRARVSTPDEPRSLIDSILGPIQTLAKRAGVFIAFIAAKQPSRIKQVLRQVYVSADNIDDDLVDSIVLPAQDGNAPEVFYRVITSNGESINSLLQKIKAPLFLLWGELDPWITPASADRIQRLFPAAERVDVRGGHCPHDDVPSLFLPPLQRWLRAHSR